MTEKQKPAEENLPTLEEIASKAGFGSFEDLWKNLEKENEQVQNLRP